MEKFRSFIHSVPKEIRIATTIAGAAMTFLALHMLATRNPSMSRLVRKIRGGRPLKPHQAQLLTEGMNSIHADFPPGKHKK